MSLTQTHTHTFIVIAGTFEEEKFQRKTHTKSTLQKSSHIPCTFCFDHVRIYLMKNLTSTPVKILQKHIKSFTYKSVKFLIKFAYGRKMHTKLHETYVNACMYALPLSWKYWNSKLWRKKQKNYVHINICWIWGDWLKVGKQKYEKWGKWEEKKVEKIKMKMKTKIKSSYMNTI